MGINLNDIRDPRLRDQIERQLCNGIGPAIPTDKPKPASDPVERESELHDQIIAICRSKGWFYVHSRMDRKSTTGVGTPDFCIAFPGGKTLWLECKRPGGKLTPAQQAAIAQLVHLGHETLIASDLNDIRQLSLTAAWAQQQREPAE